jgi:opacity protein-like surface antigen
MAVNSDIPATGPRKEKSSVDVNDGLGVETTGRNFCPIGRYESAERDGEKAAGHPHIEITAVGAHARCGCDRFHRVSPFLNCGPEYARLAAKW